MPSDWRKIDKVLSISLNAGSRLYCVPSPCSDDSAGKNDRGPSGERRLSFLTNCTFACCQTHAASSMSEFGDTKLEIPVMIIRSPLRVAFGCERFVWVSEAAFAPLPPAGAGAGGMNPATTIDCPSEYENA